MDYPCLVHIISNTIGSVHARVDTPNSQHKQIPESSISDNLTVDTPNSQHKQILPQILASIT